MVKTPPFQGGVTSSILVRVTIIGILAQPGEHLLHTQGVVGSSPANPTKDDIYNSRTRIMKRAIDIEKAGEYSSPVFLLTTDYWFVIMLLHDAKSEISS